jgi:hypothetical protein
VVSGRDTSYPINFAQAEAAFTDSLTVTGGVGQGFIVYTYTLSGAASGPSEAGAHLFLHHASDPDEELAEDVTHSGSFDSLPHQFTFGASFETRAVLDSLATLAQGQTGDGVCQFDGALTGIAVFDADMRPIGAFTIVSESGTEYPVVPSVATGAVFALAGATRALRRRRL